MARGAQQVSKNAAMAVESVGKCLKTLVPSLLPLSLAHHRMVAASMAPKQANGGAAAAAVEVVESPVAALLSKRLRNLRKRLRGIEEIQAKADAGKELNDQQVRGLASLKRASHPLGHSLEVLGCGGGREFTCCSTDGPPAGMLTRRSSCCRAPVAPADPWTRAHGAGAVAVPQAGGAGGD